MRVAQINSVCGILSTGRIAYDIATETKKYKIKNKVFYGYRKDPKNIGYKFNFDFSVHIDALLTRLFGHRGSYSRIATIKLIKKLKAYKPDIVHLHNIHGQYVNMPMLMRYLKKVNAKVIWTLHDCWAFTGDCFHFDRCKCTEWKNGCPNNCPYENVWITNSFFNNSHNNWLQKVELFGDLENMKIITPSKWLKELVEESFLSKFDIDVIYNGIDTKVFKPTRSDIRQRLGIGHKFVILGICFTLDEGDRKGGKYLIEIAKRFPECHMLILGLSNIDVDLPKNITCISKTNSIIELAKIYSVADVFINPTLEDNFPTVNIEALSCGTPVITFKTGGSPEAIDENTGIIVEQEDIDGLIRAVNRIRLNGKSKYTNSCRKRAVMLYDRNNMCEQYIKIYNSFVSEK